MITMFLLLMLMLFPYCCWIGKEGETDLGMDERECRDEIHTIGHVKISWFMVLL